MEEIYAVGGKLDLVITLPDAKATNKSGRVFVDEFCRQHGVPLLKSGHINDRDVIAAIRDHDIDWLFVIGWSQIAGPEVLGAPRQGALGMHPTLLPEGRGRAAIPWAILKGLQVTGVTLFRLVPEVDAGAIAARVEIPVGPDETATTLYQRVTEAHRALLREAFPSLAASTLQFRPQDDSRATYWPARTPADGRILTSMSTQEVERLVRATTHPYPGAFVEADGKILRIWSGQVGRTGDRPSTGAFRLTLADGVYDAIEWAWEG
jgi:methionyl-tRNA formyltransferase